MLITANRLDRSLSIIDTGRDSVVRYIPLPGAPTDVAIDPVGQYLYVTLSDIHRFSKRELQSGAEASGFATGNTPGRIFWNEDWTTVGFCNIYDRTFNPVTLSNWTMLNGLALPDMHHLLANGIVYAKDRTYLWAMESIIQDTCDDCKPGPGFLALVYTPTWTIVSLIEVGALPWVMAQSPNGKYLYLMEFYDILVFRTDTE